LSDAILPSSDKGPIDRRDLVFIAVDRAQTPMVICDPRQAGNPIVMVNQAFLDLTGYPRQEVVGRNCRLLQGPLSAREAVEALGRAVAEARAVEVEILNYRKDGSSFWNRVTLSPVHDEAGALLYFFGSQLDVTQQRLAQASEAEDIRALMREIDHRAMNALAIVEGIVRLSRAHDIKQYAEAVQQRVQALARAHAFLSESRWQAARLQDVLHLQIDPYGRRRATIAGPDILIGATLVQPLALVLHEMIANARTHGCLSRPSGRLAVRWTPHDGERGLRLIWEETGGPPPSRQRAGGFGSAMVTAIIQRQLRGQASMDWRETGLCAEFIVPDLASEPKPFRVAASA
jgi:PAS domain S-box-containing protein